MYMMIIPSAHSMWESRKTRTSPTASLYPRRRARINPWRSVARTIFTFWNCSINWSRGSLRCSKWRNKHLYVLLKWWNKIMLCFYLNTRKRRSTSKFTHYIISAYQFDITKLLNTWLTLSNTYPRTKSRQQEWLLWAESRVFCWVYCIHSLSERSKPRYGMWQWCWPLAGSRCRSSCDTCMHN